MATTALATRENTAPARADNEYGRLRVQLDNRVDDFKMALPAHITPEKFQRTFRVTGLVTPFTVRFPITWAVRPAVGATDVDLKMMVGYVCASKNSPERIRCSSSLVTPVEMLETLILTSTELLPGVTGSKFNVPETSRKRPPSDRVVC